MPLKDLLTALAFSAAAAALIMGIFYVGAVRYVELASCGAC